MKTNKKNLRKCPKKENEVPVFIVVKKHNTSGRDIVRLRENGVVHDMKNYFTSTEPYYNRDTGLFDVIDFEMKRKENKT